MCPHQFTGAGIAMHWEPDGTRHLMFWCELDCKAAVIAPPSGYELGGRNWPTWCRLGRDFWQVAQTQERSSA